MTSAVERSPLTLCLAGGLEQGPGTGSWCSPEPAPDRVEDAGQQDGKQPEPGIEIVLIPVAQPDVVIRAVGRRYLLSLRQIPVPRAIIEHAQHPRGSGRQPPDDRVLDGSYLLPLIIAKELAKPETRPEHAGSGLGTAPEFDDEPRPVPAMHIRTARRLNPGNDELLSCGPMPDRSGRCPAALKTLSREARPQRSQGLPVNHPGRYHAFHPPTISKAYSPAHDIESLLTGMRVRAVREDSRARDDGAVHGRQRSAIRPLPSRA
jgi:hypothetical protein